MCCTVRLTSVPDVYGRNTPLKVPDLNQRYRYPLGSLRIKELPELSQVQVRASFEVVILPFQFVGVGEAVSQRSDVVVQSWRRRRWHARSKDLVARRIVPDRLEREDRVRGDLSGHRVELGVASLQ